MVLHMRRSSGVRMDCMVGCPGSACAPVQTDFRVVASRPGGRLLAELAAAGPRGATVVIRPQATKQSIKTTLKSEQTRVRGQKQDSAEKNVDWGSTSIVGTE